MDNLYKKNLSILSGIQDCEGIYYSENRICKENRYFSSLRYGNNLDKILSIINISFLHYYNIILIEIEEPEEIKELLSNSIKGLKIFKIYNENNNINTNKIDNLINLFENYISNLENNTYAKSKEHIKTIQENINLIEKDISIEYKIKDNETKDNEIKDKENKSIEIDINLNKDKIEEEPSKCYFITSLFFGIRNGIGCVFFSIYNHLFIY
jgi:hypothetical protein